MLARLAGRMRKKPTASRRRNVRRNCVSDGTNAINATTVEYSHAPAGDVVTITASKLPAWFPVLGCVWGWYSIEGTRMTGTIVTVVSGRDMASSKAQTHATRSFTQGPYGRASLRRAPDGAACAIRYCGRPPRHSRLPCSARILALQGVGHGNRKHLTARLLY